MTHDAWQVLQVAPESIEHLDRLFDRHALVDVHTGVSAKRAPRVLSSSRGVDAEEVVGVAMSRGAAPDEQSAECRKHERRSPTFFREAVRREPDACGDRQPAFCFADIAASSNASLFYILWKLEFHESH